MTKRQVIWIVLSLLCIVTAAAAVWSAFTGSKVSLSTAELQSRINERLPRETKGVLLERAEIAVEDGHVAVRLGARAAHLGKSIFATVYTRGVPRYDASAGAIFFDAQNVVLEHVSFAGDGAGASPQNEGGNSIAKRMKARIGDKALGLLSNSVAGVVKSYLATRPIYRLKDDYKGVLLKAAVTGLAVEGDKVVISLTLIGLTTTVLIWLVSLALIIAAIIWVIRHPGWLLEVGSVLESS